MWATMMNMFNLKALSSVLIPKYVDLNVEKSCVMFVVLEMLVKLTARSSIQKHSQNSPNMLMGQDQRFPTGMLHVDEIDTWK